MNIIKRSDNKFVDPFYDFSKEFFGLGKNSLFPIFEKSAATNIQELENKYLVELSVPGFKKEDININIENGSIVISAEENAEVEDNTGTYHRKEFHSKSFKRSFVMPEDININEISAKCENGILMLDFPKKEKGTDNDVKVIEIK